MNDILCSVNVCGCVPFGWKWVGCMIPIPIIAGILIYLIIRKDKKEKKNEVT